MKNLEFYWPTDWKPMQMTQNWDDVVLSSLSSDKVCGSFFTDFTALQLWKSNAHSVTATSN